jgi:hypothetical protein
MRRAYGHGGTRLEHIIVSAPPMESPPTPLWLKLPVLALLLAIPVLVSLYAVPTTTIPQRTVIDISKLTIQPPPVLLKPEIPKPEPVRPVERTVEPPPKPEAPPAQTTQKTIERKSLIPVPTEMQRPAISRSTPTTLPGDGAYQPRVTRERRQVALEGGGTISTSTRLRREAVVGEAPSDKTSITRSRGATAMDSSIARERVAVLRRTSPAGESSAGSIGIGTAQRPTTVRSGRASGPLEESAPRITATKERTKLSGSGGAGGDGESTSSIGLVRGVSLMSLEICSSSQLQEEKIKDVLSVVGSRQNCRDEKGEFQFKGTKRVSSFNLMIFPSQGRKPSNRCKELEYAYTCLTTN